jgi:uncharacterized iron-regulated protein
MPVLWFCLLLLISVGISSASAEDVTQSSAPSAPPPFQVGQIWEVKTGRPITFEDLTVRLSTLDVVYLGEEHHNQWHVAAALKALNALLSHGRHPVLAMEMFGWDGQAALDRYLAATDQSRGQFLKDVHWEQMWGGPFEDYEPLIALAKTQVLSVVAINPPRSLVRLVAQQGLARALTDQAMVDWGMKDETLADEPAYREMIVQPLRQCHGGLSDEAYQRMYEASMFRDEGMAKTIVDVLRRSREGASDGLRSGAGPIVSYTGGGHIQYRLPVPQRVLRRHGGAVDQATIYLTSFEPGRADEIGSLLQENVADFLWLTPLSAHGAPRRCK